MADHMEGSIGACLPLSVTVFHCLHCLSKGPIDGGDRVSLTPAFPTRKFITELAKFATPVGDPGNPSQHVQDRQLHYDAARPALAALRV